MDRETVRICSEVGRHLSEAGVTVGEGAERRARAISRLWADVGIRERLFRVAAILN